MSYEEYVGRCRRRDGVFASICLLLLIALVGLLAVLPRSVHAQTSTHPGQLNYSLQTTPGPIPTSLTTVYAGDAYVCEADFTGTGQNILVEDIQVTPVPWINNTLGSSMSPTTWYWLAPSDFTCRHFPYGVQWQAGASGVTGYIIVKHN